MVAAHGMGAGTAAAEMLVLVGDDPQRIRSEAAFAKLCGACPIPASSGKTSRHRLNRGGHRQANAALHRVVVVRMRTHQPTVDYVRRRTAEGKSKRGDHPLPQALRGTRDLRLPLPRPQAHPPRANRRLTSIGASMPPEEFSAGSVDFLVWVRPTPAALPTTTRRSSSLAWFGGRPGAGLPLATACCAAFQAGAAIEPGDGVVPLLRRLRRHDGVAQRGMARRPGGRCARRSRGTAAGRGRCGACACRW